MDFSKFAAIARRYLWLFLLVTLVASLTTYFAFSSKPTIYEAKARLLVGPSLDSPSPDLNALRIGGQLIQTYAELVSSRPFLESVNSKLDQKIDPQQLAGMIEAKQNIDTRILTIFVRHRDPNQAVAIANAIGSTLVDLSPSRDNTTALLRDQLSNQSKQLEQILSSTETNINELEAKLANLENASLPSPEAVQANLDQQNLVIRQLADERARLSETLRTPTSLYAVLRDTNTNQVQVVEPAGVVFPVNQNIPLRVAAAGLAGLILAMCIIFSVEYFGDTIRYPGDFNKVAKAPLLSTIDSHTRLDDPGLDQIVTLSSPGSRAANAYRTAAAKLLFSGGESDPHSYLLSNVGSLTGEGTAEVAANLGVAFAQAGKRVVLVDAQFQNPQLTNIFEAEDKPGLVEFMTAGSPKLKLSSTKADSGLRILPAGIAAEKGAGATLNGTKVANLVEELRQSDVDVVLIAGAPISSFAESMILAKRIDGVILVTRHGEARVKMVNEAIKNLLDIKAHIAGIIFVDHQPSFVRKPRTKTVFDSAPVVSEDSHVS